MYQKPIVVKPSRFSLEFNQNEENWLIESRRTLDEILEEEATEQYQQRFQNLDKERSRLLAEEIKSFYSGQEEFNLDFLTKIIQYTFNFFQNTKREVEINNVSIYTMSHFHTPSLFASKLGMDFSTIRMIYLHDILEEIMDRICESSYGYNLRLLNNFDDVTLRDMIHSLNDSFLPDGKSKKAETAQSQIDEYKDLRSRIIRIIVQDFRDLRKKTVESKPYAEEYYSDIISLDVLTRIPGEPWKETIDRIFDRNNYSRIFYLADLQKKFSESPEKFSEYKDNIRIKSVLGKLFDALHNIKTQGPIFIPDINLNQESSRINLDSRMKSLLKRFYTVDFAKDLLLHQLNENQEIDGKYNSIYRLHRLLSLESMEEAENICISLKSKYENLTITDPKIKKQYGFRRDTHVTYSMIFERIKEAMTIYSIMGLLARITEKEDEMEKSFEKKMRVSFAGTIRRIRDYADNKIDTLYNGFCREGDVIDCFKDTYALRALFLRYLSRDIDGKYKSNFNNFCLYINKNLH